MNRLFKKFGKKSKDVTTEQAEDELVDAKEMLNKKQEKLEQDIAHQVKMAKQYGTKQKKR